MNKNNKATTTHKVYQVTEADLPISCPTDDIALWSAHPRVFIPLDNNNKEEHCPYCSAKFVLID